MKLKKDSAVTVLINGVEYNGFWIGSYVLRGTEYNSIYIPTKAENFDTWSVEDSQIIKFDAAPFKAPSDGRRRQLQKSLDIYTSRYTVLSESADLNDKKVQKELAKLQSMIDLRKSQLASL